MSVDKYLTNFHCLLKIKSNHRGLTTKNTIRQSAKKKLTLQQNKTEQIQCTSNSKKKECG